MWIDNAILPANGSFRAEPTWIPAGGSVVTLIHDAFVAPDGAGLNGRTPSPIDNGNNWSVVSGTWQMFSNVLTQQDQFVTKAASLELGVSDCSITINAYVGAVYVVPSFRSVDVNNGLNVVYTPTGDITLNSIVAGASVQIGSTSSGNPTSGTVLLGIVLSGQSVIVTVNGSVKISESTALFQTATLFLIQMNRQGAVNANVADDLLVTVP